MGSLKLYSLMFTLVKTKQVKFDVTVMPHNLINSVKTSTILLICDSHINKVSKHNV